jgi:alkanesulfonate monooxygenase SsuD/methylene tetrahydromethanopterin reductase-like flavin-dependent oxidoreductase (luciferase family)
MNFGLVMRTDVPPQAIIELASLAEDAGWNGFFIWDGFLGPNPSVLLGAVAARTKRLQFGTMLTAASVRQPWELAAEAATLDQLSNGRLILSLGLGAADDAGFARVGAATERKIRAQLLDESLDILYGLWRGGPFDYEGKHYTLKQASLQLLPVQSLRIRVWVVGAWPSVKSMQRVVRCDGIIPAKLTAQGVSYDIGPADIQAMRAFVEERRTVNTVFDFIMEGETPGDNRAQAAAIVQPFAEAGATWWLECVAATPYKRGGVEGVRARILQGPPA